MRTSFQICILSIVALFVGITAPRVNAQCTGDVIPSGIIDGVDLAQTLSSWGPCTNCPADIDSDGVVTGNDLGQLLAGWGPCAPFIASVAPSQGVIVGGTPITISGSYFTGATSVTIDGAPVINMVVVSSTTITAVTPAHAAGSVSITITTPSRTTTFQNAFSYSIIPSWATMLEALPDPAVVTDASLRAAIAASGSAWRVRDNGTGIEMLLVPGGTFMMGCSDGDTDCGSETPHQVTLTNAFYMGKTEVTQAQWQAKMGNNPSYWIGMSNSPSRPVDSVSWNMIQPFCVLSGLRLPTEAEWEFACRAGTTTPRYGVLDDVGWYVDNQSGGTRPVATKLPNAFGLYDTIGNVYEWCQDWFGAYGSASVTNPAGPRDPTDSSGPYYRLLRGGCWIELARHCRSSDRGTSAPIGSNASYGFRVARNP